MKRFAISSKYSQTSQDQITRYSDSHSSVLYIKFFVHTKSMTKLLLSLINNKINIVIIQIAIHVMNYHICAVRALAQVSVLVQLKGDS